MIERNHHTLQKALSSSKVLRNFDLSLLQKRVSEIQGSAQVSVTQKCTSMCHTETPKLLKILMRLLEHPNNQQATVWIRHTPVPLCSLTGYETNNMITQCYWKQLLQSQQLIVGPPRLCWRRLGNGEGKKRPTTASGGGLRNRNKSWRECWGKLRAAYGRLEMLRNYWRNTP